MIRQGTLLFLALLVPALALGGERHRYRQQTGEEIRHFDWRLEGGEELRLLSSSPDEEHLCVLTPSLQTLRWALRRPGERTEVRARREGERLHLEGTFRGKAIRRTERLDEAPWFQALSLSLGGLARGKGGEVEFWTLRPDTLELHRMRALREREEVIEVGGRSLRATLVTIRPVGLAGLFWKGRYWFDDDSRFLRYEGASGPPGSPTTVVERVAAAGEY